MQNITDLRNSLLENYKLTKENKMALDKNKVLSNNASKILGTLKVELNYNSQVGNKKKIKFLETK